MRYLVVVKTEKTYGHAVREIGPTVSEACTVFEDMYSAEKYAESQVGKKTESSYAGGCRYEEVVGVFFYPLRDGIEFTHTLSRKYSFSENTDG